ncbi:Sec-independent protein translocase protein TatB [Mangrovitalea sediminis]|uniref:Sec-independent protein translocase protein TatB n=1 Tax=Mangrovitalea sediminis TaxID=1982043 RepID=UPI000BE52254|nr:Sec-independent protein translocase protein TatB [Mangrovitalea sediminis]
MFDIGFPELVVCAVIALIVLGPERLPAAARTAGRWVGRARRMVRQFSDELDRQLKADELRERIRKEGGEVGLDDIQRTVNSAMDEARQYEHMILPDKATDSTAPEAPSAESTAASREAAEAATTARADTPAASDKQ